MSIFRFRMLTLRLILASFGKMLHECTFQSVYFSCFNVTFLIAWCKMKQILMFEKQIEMLCHIGLFKFAPLNPKKRFFELFIINFISTIT